MQTKIWKAAIFTTVFTMTLAWVTLGLAQNAGKTKPIKIGIINTFTGAYAEQGESTEKGFRIILKQHNYQVAGRKIEISMDDDQMNPVAAMTKTKRMVETEGVNILAGYFSSSCALGVIDYINSKKIPVIFDGGGATVDLNTKKWSPYMFRFSTGALQMSSGEGEL